jgi:hypothetical protein
MIGVMNVAANLDTIIYLLTEDDDEGRRGLDRPPKTGPAGKRGAVSLPSASPFSIVRSRRRRKSA